MQFLIPSAGELPHGFPGVITTYKHKHIPKSIRQGAAWAGDNCAFSGFDAGKFLRWLKQMEPYRSTCLFITVPDVVANADATMAMYSRWRAALAGWPLAFVIQDGQERLDWPALMDVTDFAYDHLQGDDDYAWHAFMETWQRDCLDWQVCFVGGSTEWKLSETAADLIQEARRLGKRIHVGRVNYRKRYDHFATLPGAREFTCDGTRPRFDGKDTTLTAWRSYQLQPNLWS